MGYGTASPDGYGAPYGATWSYDDADAHASVTSYFNSATITESTGASQFNSHSIDRLLTVLVMKHALFFLILQKGQSTKIMAFAVSAYKKVPHSQDKVRN